MQPRINATRSGLTVAQVEALIKTDASIKIGMGMELLDRGLNVIKDLTTELEECSVSRDNTATLNGGCAFTTVARMSWGRAVVRPYITISNGTLKARFNQGAYFTNIPATRTDRQPAKFSVTGFDILNALNSLVGDSFAINKGESYLTTVENILLGQGYSRYIIDPARLSTTAAVAKAWPLDESTTWLMIVNELLTAVGYDPVYSDWDGALVCESMRDNTTRSAEWTYTRGQFDGQMKPEQEIVHDFFATPNRWVGIQGNRNTDVAPTVGNGVFVYVNQNDGETSVSAREQTITKPLTITVADQAALVAAVMAQVAKDKNVGTTMTAQTSANPLHWHKDVIDVETIELGKVKMQQVNWSMNLRTGDMSHSWAVV